MEKIKGTIYIAGSITDIDFNQAKAAFELAEARLIQHFQYVVNPMNLNHHHDKSWASYMKVCINHLIKCDYIYMIQGWEKSKGARIELNLAIDLGLEVRYHQ